MKNLSIQGRISHTGKLGTCLGQHLSRGGTPHQKKKEVLATNSILMYSLYIFQEIVGTGGHSRDQGGEGGNSMTYA